MKTANLGVGVMLLGMLAASACGDDASGGGTPTGGTAGSGGTTGGSGGKGGSAGKGGTTGGSAGKGGSAGSGSAGKGGSGGKGGSAGSGTGGSSAVGGTTGDAGGSGEAGAETGGTSGGTAGSVGTGGNAGVGGIAGSGGANAGTGGMGGLAAQCELTTDVVGSCEVPANPGVGSCVEYHAGGSATPEIVEAACDSTGGSFIEGGCPSISFEDVNRIGCCVVPGSLTKNCYYGDPESVLGVGLLCASFGCNFEPG